MDWYVAKDRKMALSSTFPAHRPRIPEAAQALATHSCRGINWTCEALKVNLTFYSREEEECDYSIVESTSGLGDTGQDGKRVQKVTVRRGGTVALHIHVSLR